MELQDKSWEKELLQELNSGSKQAFEVLYTQYYPRLYLHAYNRLRDREAAKDLIHDLFASLWTKRNELHITSGLSSYLYHAVRNRVIDHISRQHIRSSYIQSLGKFLEQPEGSTDHLVRENQLASLIDEEINKLSPQVKKVFELSRKEHRSHKEIATELGLSEQTVRDYIKTALKTLRIRFGSLFILALAQWLE